MHTVISPDKRPVLAAEGVLRSDAAATNSAANRKLFKSRVPIYPKEAEGTYRSVKWAMMAITLSIYYLVPWLRWNRGAGAPHQHVQAVAFEQHPGRQRPAIAFAGRHHEGSWLIARPDVLVEIEPVHTVAHQQPSAVDDKARTEECAMSIRHRDGITLLVDDYDMRRRVVFRRRGRISRFDGLERPHTIRVDRLADFRGIGIRQ